MLPNKLLLVFSLLLDMNLLELMLRRETRGTRYPIFHGLRPIRLDDILPFSLRREVILGFTADGRFILSHFLGFCQFKLSFWLVHGFRDSNSWFDKPFAVYTQTLSDGRIDDQVGVRFFQSIHDPTKFALILSWVSTTNASYALLRALRT